MTGRATATILFTDLVGSTELRGRLGEEAADELRRKHDQLLAQAVEANNGRVVKGLGDGIMATFAGAADAVAAAVAIQQAVDRLNRSGKAPVPLAVRVGLSAGDVSFEDDDVHGTPVIEASRLCAVGGGAEVLVSEVVRLLAGLTDDDIVDRGPLELKGLQKTVPTWKVLWQPAAVSTIPMPALLTEVGRIFVGRDRELERLGRLWKEAAAGERRVAFLAGEPGVGKTRLTAEIAMRAHDEGGVVLAGRCDEDLGVPYQPFVEALRHFVDHTPPGTVKEGLGRYGGELARLVPELAERVPDLPRPLQSDPETERYRLFDAVAAWLAALSTDDPVLLVLDDLQWAAKPTLLLLRHILRVPELRRALIVGTYRDTELGHEHPLVEVLADLRREAGVERASLTGLDPSGVAAFMEQAAGHPMGDEELALASAIHEETEGNPFFVREVLRHLAETGAIDRERGHWGARLPVEELGIPESVREVVGRRLARLSEHANQALRVAAVAGPEFELPVVQAAGQFDEEPLLRGLEEATKARLITETAGAQRYRFAHALVRDTLYGNLSAARQVILHRQVAEAIETLHAARLDDDLPALAHHWARASAPTADNARAVDYAARAGRRALTQLAHDEAVGYYRQALELLDAANQPPAGPQRLELLLGLGEAQRRAGEPAYRETLLEAAHLAELRGDATALARAALANNRGTLMSSVGAVDEERVAVLEAALEALGDGDLTTRARLLASLGLELVFSPDRDRRVPLSDESLALARRSGDPDTLVHVLVARYHTINTPATLDERLANTAELVQLAEGLGDPRMLAWARGLRVRAAMETAQVDEARRILDLVEAGAAELGQPMTRWMATYMRAAVCLWLGRVDRAERLVEEAAELGEAIGQPDAPLYAAAQRFLVRFEQGRLDELCELWEQLDARSPDFAVLPTLLAFLYTETGRTDEARPLFERLAATGFNAVPFDILWSTTVCLLADVASRLGDRPRAETLLRLLTPYADRVPGVGPLWVGSVSYYLGLLAATLGRFDEAEAHLSRAAETHQRSGASAWLARTRLEWGRMLLSRRQPGDAERARELLGQALFTARELGLATVERRAVALLSDGP